MQGTAVRASLDERWSAYQLDGLILLLPSLVLFFKFLYDANLDVFSLMALWALIWYVYFGGFWWLNDGQTPGMLVRRIQVVRRNGGAPGFWRSLVRVTGLFFGSFFGVTPLTTFLDPESVGLHDRLADTRVVRIRR